MPDLDDELARGSNGIVEQIGFALCRGVAYRLLLFLIGFHRVLVYDLAILAMRGKWRIGRQDRGGGVQHADDADGDPVRLATVAGNITGLGMQASQCRVTYVSALGRGE